MATLWQDVRYAFRMLAKSPMLTVIVILTLTLGIGANTAIFGLVNGLLLRPLPVKSPNQIMVLAAQVQGDTLSIYTLSHSELIDLRKQSDVFSDVFGFQVNLGGLSYGGKANQFVYGYVTGNYFSGLGLQPALGRLFLPAEGEAGGKDPYIVLGYDFWQKRFGGNPEIVGKQALIDGQEATIIGVTPKGVDKTMINTSLSEQDIAECRDAERNFFRFVRMHNARVALAQHLSLPELTGKYQAGYYANQEVAKEENVPYTDDADELQGQLKSAQSPFYAGDPLHLSGPGQPILAHTLRRAVDLAIMNE